MTVPQLVATDHTPLDIVETIGHAVIDKAESEAFNMAQLNEPEAVVLILWGFYGLAMNHPLDEALLNSSVSALYLALHRIGAPHIAAALARADDSNFFHTYQADILALLLAYIQANKSSILANEQIDANVAEQ